MAKEKVNPFERMSKERKQEREALLNGATTEEVEEVQADGRGKNEKSLANIHPRIANEVKTPQSYMSINVWEYEDYLKRMSKFMKVPTTKYVLSLIEADMRLNKDLYEKKLKLDSSFDWEKKESPNSKKAKSKKK